MTRDLKHWSDSEKYSTCSTLSTSRSLASCKFSTFRRLSNCSTSIEWDEKSPSVSDNQAKLVVIFHTVIAFNSSSLYASVANTSYITRAFSHHCSYWTLSAPVPTVTTMAEPQATALHWQDLCNSKRERQLASIPREWIIDTSSLPPNDQLDVSQFPLECGLLSEFELEITEEDDVDALLAKLASGEWSCVNVTTAYYKRAVIAHQVVSSFTTYYAARFDVDIIQVNCLTEIFVDRALERARELDKHLKATGKPIGPLHGLPISLKDQVRIKGLETTMGIIRYPLLTEFKLTMESG